MEAPVEARQTWPGTTSLPQSYTSQFSFQDAAPPGQGADFVSYGDDIQPFILQRDRLLCELDQSTAEFSYLDALNTTAMDTVTECDLPVLYSTEFYDTL